MNVKAESTISVYKGVTTITWFFENGVQAIWTSNTRVLTICSCNNVVLDRYENMNSIDDILEVLFRVQEY